MQVERTRAYRVKAVAAILDVSVSTIYRAIQAGELDAYRLGTGKGAVRIPGHAIGVYLKGCAQAAYDTDDDAAGELTPAQADGLACVVCGADYREVSTPHVPVGGVGRSQSGSQVFACTEHAGQASGRFGEVVA